MSLFDDLVGVGAGFDWITPIKAMVVGLMNGPCYTFIIERAGCPLSGREVSQMLTQNGVKNGNMVGVPSAGVICLDVAEEHAARAQQLFDRYGVVVQNPVAARAEKGGQKRGSMFGIFD